MKIGLFAAIAALAIAVPAAAQERTAVRQDFELPANSGKTILVFRPQVRVGAQSTGGMFEPNGDWTETARVNIATALAERQEKLGNKVVSAAESYGDDALRVEEYSRLFAAVSQAVIQYQFFVGNRLPTKKRDNKAGVFDWSLGEGVQSLPGAKDADYGLFLYNKDAYGSTGRKLLQVVALMGPGLAVKSGEHAGYAGLVDSEDRQPAVVERGRRDGRRRAGAGRCPQACRATAGGVSRQRDSIDGQAVNGLLAAALALALSAPAGAVAAPVKPAPPPPPYAGAYQPTGIDEIGLWREDDEHERALANSSMVIRDEALNGYVRRVLCASVGPERCAAVRIYVVRFPLFNASMSPNGTMQVNSGLLLRTRSEAELAAVLGHEFGHFEKRHTLQHFKARRSGSDLLSWAAMLTAMSGSAQTYRSFDTLQLSVLGGLARYGRDQEREADLLGLGYLNASALRPNAASRVWRNLILEQEASAASRGLRKPAFDRVAFFASHPADGERADYLYSLSAPDGETRDEGMDRYAAALAPWLPVFLNDQIKLNDFGASDFIINRLGESGWTAALWRARGDLFRLRGHQRDLMNAADYYAKAVALDPALPAAQRGLGLSLVKTGRTADGRAALQRYLELEPDAPDAAMINLTISSLGNTQ